MGAFAGHALRSYVAGGEFIATRNIDVGVRVIKAGERFPWRDLGMHEVRVHQLWRANMVDSAPPARPPQQPKRK